MEDLECSSSCYTRCSRADTFVQKGGTLVVGGIRFSKITPSDAWTVLYGSSLTAVDDRKEALDCLMALVAIAAPEKSFWTAVELLLSRLGALRLLGLGEDFSIWPAVDGEPHNKETNSA